MIPTYGHSRNMKIASTLQSIDAKIDNELSVLKLDVYKRQVIVVAVCAWLCRFVLVGQHIEIAIDHFLHWLHHCQQLLAHRYLCLLYTSDGCGGAKRDL